MNKILSVLLAMTMLFSVMFTLGVSADGNTIVVTQATMGTDGNVTVAGKVTSGTPGAVTILATVQEGASDKAALGTMADGSSIAYVDQKTPAQDGTFTFKFKPKAGLTGSHTTIYVCAAGVTAENMFAENLTGNNVTVNYGTITDTVQSVNGVVTIKLRPVTEQGKQIATKTGYFKQWDVLGQKVNTADTKKEHDISSAIQNGIITVTPEYFTDPAHTTISAAKAQKVTLANGDLAIRFLALVGEDYEDYAHAGFVFSTLGENPTVEAGYKPYQFDSLYKKIVLAGNQVEVSNAAFNGLFGSFTLVPTGILYANLVIENTDAAKATTYYATPYLEDAQGNRVYGATKAISYNGLAELDAIN